MNKKIVVENTLQSHINYLKNEGYDVHKLYKNENFNNITTNAYDAIVISSLDKMPGGTVSTPNAHIVEAEGKTPQEVLSIIKTK